MKWKSRTARWGVSVGVCLLWGCTPADSTSDAEAAPDRRPAGVKIAVLPFGSADVDEAGRSFAADLHDGLIRYLSQAGLFEVVPRTAVLEYAETGAPPSEVADVFGLDAVMDGSLRRVGEDIEVDVALLDGITETVLWSRRYESRYSVESLNDFHMDVAQRVADVLQADRPTGFAASAAAPGTAIIEAYDCNNRGVRLLIERGTADRAIVDRIREDLECAVEADPDFGQAWGTLAIVRGVYPWRSWESEGGRAAAEAATLEALRLEPEALETRLAQGYMEYFSRRYLQALVFFESAHATWPGDARAAQALTLALRRAGNWDEAARVAGVSRSLNPGSAFWRVLATTYRAVGRFDDARAVLDAILETESEAVLAAVREERFLTALYAGGVLEAMAVMVQMDAGASATERASWNARVDFYRGNYDDMLRYARGTSDRERHLLMAEAAHFAGRTELRRIQADSALTYWERVADEAMEGSNAHVSALAKVGLSHALLGWRAEALEMAGRAVEILPVSVDAFEGPILLWQLARTHALVGNPEGALDALERSIALPGGYPPGLLDIDPTWGPFRHHPRMLALDTAY